jgi:hypothetical protein
MKKQILILVLAIFAIGFSSTAFAQFVPRPITCLSADALHPIAGQPYDYTISVPTPIGDKTVLWMATQSTTFITNEAVVAAAEVAGVSAYLAANGANYNIATTDLFTMSLTWKSFTYDPAAPVFVLVNVVNADGTCSPNNLKIWRIEPINAFTLDIDNRLMDNAGDHTPEDYGDDYERCRSSIASAAYNFTTEGVTYDFGRDSLFFQVVAANWSGAWKPSFTIAGVDANQTIVRVMWSSTVAFPAPTAGSDNLCTLNGSDEWVANGLVIPSGGATGSVGSAGEIIYVKVVIAHNNVEGIAPQQITVATDGELFYIDDPTATPLTYTAAGVYDVHHDNGTATPPDPCDPLVEDGFTNDLAIQTLLPRPSIQPGTPGYLGID